MRYLFIFLGFLSFNYSSAQENSGLYGKWKFMSVTWVISESADSVYYDLAKDSIYIPEKDLKDALRDGHDSISVVDILKNMFASVRGAILTFDTGSVFVHSKELQMKGKYQVNPGNNLKILWEGNENESEFVYSYFLVGDKLKLVLYEDRGYSKFILKRE